MTSLSTIFSHLDEQIFDYYFYLEKGNTVFFTFLLVRRGSSCCFLVSSQIDDS